MKENKTIRVMVDACCPKCKDYLAMIPRGTDIYCPRCSKWCENVGGEPDQQTLETAKAGK